MASGKKVEVGEAEMEEVFDVLPTVCSLLENIVTSNVVEKLGDQPKRVDVTAMVTALKQKLVKAEAYVEALPGGECGFVLCKAKLGSNRIEIVWLCEGELSQDDQQRELERLQLVLKKKT